MAYISDSTCLGLFSIKKKQKLSDGFGFKLRKKATLDTVKRIFSQGVYFSRDLIQLGPMFALSRLKDSVVFRKNREKKAFYSS